MLHIGAIADSDSGSGVVIVIVNVLILPVAVVLTRADMKARAFQEEEKLRLYGKLMRAQVSCHTAVGPCLVISGPSPSSILLTLA